jgi:hypothetical protein
VTEFDTAPIPISEVHRSIGSIVAAATSLELTLGEAVSSLTRSPLTALLVQGERGGTLIGMACRLLDRGIGSTEDEERSGKTRRLGLLSAEDTALFQVALAQAETLLKGRDNVVHSLWLANMEPGVIHGQRTTRARQYVRRWTLAELERLRQDLANAQADIFICSWNTSGSGMSRMEPRTGDVF